MPSAYAETKKDKEKGVREDIGGLMAELSKRPTTPERIRKLTGPERAAVLMLALGEKHSLDADPSCEQKQCPPDYQDLESRMLTYADLATVGLVTFIAGAGAGTYFLLTAKPKSSSAHVVPWFVGTAAGVSGRF